MKICQYCNSANSDDAKTCSTCGASEFSYKCNNCGTVYHDGAFCPKCGTKAGQKAKTCPNCGTEYYTNACPNCGYNGTKSNNNNSSPTMHVYYSTQTADTGIAANSAAAAKKGRSCLSTCLWILGWIYIFPVPVTILVRRNQKMSKVLKIILIAAAWFVYLFAFYYAGQNSKAKETTAATSQILPLLTHLG